MKALLRVGACLAGLSGAACHLNNPVYVPAPAVLETDGSGDEVTGTVGLKFRPPSMSEQADLDRRSGELGYQVPWLRQDQVHLEVRYTITNRGDRDGLFALFVDGATEFTRFDYQAVAGVFDAANEDAPQVGLLQPSNAPILHPGQVHQGVLREDDFREASLDLDAMGRFMAPFVAVLLNRSEVTPVGLEMAPPYQDPAQEWILPALWEVTARFSADQPMTCQFIVRIRDDGGRLWEDGDSEFSTAPATFTPVLP